MTMPLPPGSSAPRGPRHRREAITFVATWSAALATGCVPGPSANRAALAELDRFAYPAVLDPGAPDGTVDVAAVRAGVAEDPRLIWVHGTPGSAAAFADYLIDPVPGWESVAIDRPGFGATTPGRSWPRFDHQARAIEPLLESRAGRWPVLVGHSLGGPIVARVAADHPDRVGGLVILAGSLDPGLESPRWFNHLAEWMIVRPFIGRTMRTSNDEIMAAVAETVALDAVLARVRCPVVIIHGTDDSLVPVGNVDYMQDRFGDLVVRTIVLDGEGHFLPWRREALIRSVIADLTPTEPTPLNTAATNAGGVSD